MFVLGLIYVVLWLKCFIVLSGLVLMSELVFVGILNM